MSWRIRLVFPAALAYALLTRNGKLLEGIVWRAFGWASYLSLRKPLSVHGQPEFEYYIPDR